MNVNHDGDFVFIDDATADRLGGLSPIATEFYGVDREDCTRWMTDRGAGQTEDTVHESLTRQLELAESLARRVHEGQLDKADLPYIDHPRRVAAKLTEPRAQAVAWLHDVIEDDPETTEDELRLQFDDAIVDAVVALTRVKGEADEVYYARVRCNELALQVKHADIHDNLDPLRTALLDRATVKRLGTKYGKALTQIFG